MENVKNELEKIIEEQLRRAWSEGAIAASATFAGVVYSKIENLSDKPTKKELQELVNDIKKYCEYKKIQNNY